MGGWGCYPFQAWGGGNLILSSEVPSQQWPERSSKCEGNPEENGLFRNTNTSETKISAKKKCINGM